MTGQNFPRAQGKGQTIRDSRTLIPTGAEPNSRQAFIVNLTETSQQPVNKTMTAEARKGEQAPRSPARQSLCRCVLKKTHGAPSALFLHEYCPKITPSAARSAQAAGVLYV